MAEGVVDSQQGHDRRTMVPFSYSGESLTDREQTKDTSAIANIASKEKLGPGSLQRSGRSVRSRCLARVVRPTPPPMCAGMVALTKHAPVHLRGAAPDDRLTKKTPAPTVPS